MKKEFNKKLMLDNITYLLQNTNKKVGELETEAEVSIGYISRLSKDEKTKPSIEFVVKVANSFNVSIDTLVNINLSECSSTEMYLISFLDKLIKDTKDNKLDWDKESEDLLNRYELEYDINGPYVSHPMLSYETFMEESECDYPNEVSRVIMMSDSFGCNTYINGDCFNLKLKNETKLYLMSISKNVYNSRELNKEAKELWIYTPTLGKSILCSTFRNNNLSDMIENLYKEIEEYQKHPKIKDIYKYAIDAFMRDDLEDDKPDLDDLPF